MADSQAIRKAVLQRLSEVIDPETGMDVVRMRLIEDLSVDELGCVHYTFHPSSPICPLTVPLVNSIWHAVEGVQGVSRQEIRITNFVMAEELTQLLKNMVKEGQNSPEQNRGMGKS